MARKREVLPPTAPLLCDHIMYKHCTGGHCRRMERQRTPPRPVKRAHQLHWTSHVASK